MSKAAAIRFFTAHIGQVFHTFQVRPDGRRWEPGPRTLAPNGERRFTLDGSTVEFTAAHRVTAVTDTSVTVELLTDTDDNDGRVIHTTTYTVASP